MSNEPTTIPSFSNHLPVRIRFGDGVSGEVADALKNQHARRALVVIDAELEGRNPGVATAIGSLTGADIEVDRFVKEPGEPTIDIIDAAAEAFERYGPQAVIAIGGGSVIDTAKTARLCHQTGKTFRQWLASDRPFPEPQIPLVAIPTTAGTGSEVSGGAVISDPNETRKAGIASPTLRPYAALVDPTLTYSVPPATTAFTGIDALAQAIAAMIAKVSTPIGDGIALESIRLIGRSLTVATKDGNKRTARSEMACGSLMAGLSMNVSDCTAEHSLGQAIGAVFDVPHGLTVGVVLGPMLDRERQHVPDVLERVADALDYPQDGSNDGSRAVKAVDALLAELDFPVLSSIGVDESHLDTLADIALEDFFHTQSPAPWSRDELRGALEAALHQRERVPA
jgi:alcohol dehydrogenase class IV